MVLSALQAGNKGTQACITAASAVSGIIADLDTTIMFASAGTLNAEDDESFADHRLELEKDQICLSKLILIVQGISKSTSFEWRTKIFPLPIFHLKLTE